MTKKRVASLLGPPRDCPTQKEAVTTSMTASSYLAMVMSGLNNLTDMDFGIERKKSLSLLGLHALTAEAAIIKLVVK